MKITVGEDTTKRQGTIEFTGTKEMGLSARNAAKLALLLTDLYSDPEAAVIREYIANGLDAHKASNNSDPIDVYAPTEDVPEFRVKDHGIGMSLDTLTNVCAQYGESTKDQSDDEIGGFGLGFKSGLTISSQFSVSTTHDGITTMAIIQKVDGGLPKINVISSMKTGNPDGTMVSIPINKIEKFRTKILEFMFFTDQSKITLHDMHEEVKHYSSVTAPVYYDNIDGSNISILNPDFSRNSFLYSDRTTVIMSGIPYHVDSLELVNRVRDSGNDDIRIIRGYHTVIEAPIGSVSLTPNRENIRYTEHTIDFFRDISSGLVDRIKDKAYIEINKATNVREAYLAYNKTMLRELGIKAVWDGWTISRYIDLKFTRIASPDYYMDSNTIRYNKEKNEDGKEFKLTLSLESPNFLYRSTPVITDAPKSFTKTVKKYLQLTANKYVSSVDVMSDGLDSSITLGNTTYTYKELFESIGLEDIDKTFIKYSDVVDYVDKNEDKVETKSNAPKSTVSNRTYSVLHKDSDGSINTSTFSGKGILDLIEENSEIENVVFVKSDSIRHISFAVSLCKAVDMVIVDYSSYSTGPISKYFGDSVSEYFLDSDSFLDWAVTWFINNNTKTVKDTFVSVAGLSACDHSLYKFLVSLDGNLIKKSSPLYDYYIVCKNAKKFGIVEFATPSVLIRITPNSSKALTDFITDINKATKKIKESEDYYDISLLFNRSMYLSNNPKTILDVFHILYNDRKEN